MINKANKSLKKMDRLELLQLLVEQGEELERTQEALKAAEARAAHQERIARMAEDAVSKLAGILEAAQMHQETYSRRLKDLKAEMGLKTETVFGEEQPQSASYSSSATAQSSSDTTESTSIKDFDAEAFVTNTLGISADDDAYSDEFEMSDLSVTIPDYAPNAEDLIQEDEDLQRIGAHVLSTGSYSSNRNI